MSQIEVLYVPTEAEPAAPGETPLDAANVLERLRAVAGDEMAAGWKIVDASRMSAGDGRTDSWSVLLEHDTTGSSIEIRERLVTAADPNFRLRPDLVGTASDLPSVRPETPAIDSFSLPLPAEVPSILRGSEAAQGKRAAAQGVLSGIFVSAILGLLTPHASVIRHMFDPTSPTAAVPTGILCLFFWGLTYGLSRRRRLEALDALNGADLLPAVVSGLKSNGVERLELALRGQDDQYSVVRYSPLLRRIWVTLEQWLIRPSLQNANLVIEQQVISDREATQRAFNLLRIFVWATPVLGLIGTVVGISIAVGGFASFLSTNVDDISKIKEGLVGVTGGLSFAFLITLEGLLSSLILMLFTSTLQTREERFYAGIERDVAERFLPELQRISPERDPGGVTTGSDAWVDAMSEAARKVIRAVEIAGKRILAKWDEKHEVYVSDLNEVGATVNGSAQQVAAALDAAATATGELCHITNSVLIGQAVLQTAMVQLRESGLSEVLSELDASLRDLKPLLSNLSQPFVLQAIPAPVRDKKG